MDRRLDNLGEFSTGDHRLRFFLWLAILGPAFSLRLADDFVEERRGGVPWAIPPTSTQWNVLMHGIKKLVLELGLGECVRPPIEYGAALSWGGFQHTLIVRL